MKIAIIDYGMGNLKNVQKALAAIGFESVITDDLATIQEADKLILPGVGAFEQAIARLRESGMAEVIKEEVAKGKPLLGICLGMQLLFDKGYENGVHEGLGLIEGEVVRFDVPLKIPHMGWNTLEITKEEPLFTDLSPEPYVYFVHSYHLETQADVVSAYTTYGKRVPVAVQKGSIYGLQFHPEKSSKDGLAMLRHFATL